MADLPEDLLADMVPVKLEDRVVCVKCLLAFFSFFFSMLLFLLLLLDVQKLITEHLALKGHSIHPAHTLQSILFFLLFRGSASLYPAVP